MSKSIRYFHIGIEWGLDRLFDLVQKTGFLDDCIDLAVPLTAHWNRFVLKTWSPITKQWVLC